VLSVRFDFVINNSQQQEWSDETSTMKCFQRQEAMHVTLNTNRLPPVVFWNRETECRCQNDNETGWWNRQKEDGNIRWRRVYSQWKSAIQDVLSAPALSVPKKRFQNTKLRSPLELAIFSTCYRFTRSYYRPPYSQAKGLWR